jgi:hypothetical protein
MITHLHHSYSPLGILYNRNQERSSFLIYYIRKVTHNAKIRKLFRDGLVIRVADENGELEILQI